jgi:YVTN family beta-propeller protein
VGTPIALPSAAFVAVSPDGRQVYVTNSGSGSGSVSVVDAGSGVVVGSPILVGERPVGVAVSPDGRRLYVANNGDSTLSVIDIGLR